MVRYLFENLRQRINSLSQNNFSELQLGYLDCCNLLNNIFFDFQILIFSKQSDHRGVSVVTTETISNLLTTQISPLTIVLSIMWLLFHFSFLHVHSLFNSLNPWLFTCSITFMEP